MSHLYFDTEEKKPKSFELPGAKPHYNPDRPGQVNHILLDLVLDIPNQSFQGTCTITITPVRKDIKQLILVAVDLFVSFPRHNQKADSLHQLKLTQYLNQPHQE